MNLRSFAFLPKTFVGIDIGTSAIKIVEVSRWGDRRSLKNYGEMKASTLYTEPFRKFEQNSLSLQGKDIARAIRAIYQEAKIQSKQAIFSLPDFSSFFTRFEIPRMTKEELQEAVAFEARKHVPLPLSQVTFDWQIIESNASEKKPYKILLVAVPKEVISQYEEIAAISQVHLVAMEAEVFGLIRAAIGNDDMVPLVLLDIGAQTTTVNAVYKRQLRLSHSIDLSGDDFTWRIAQSLSIDTKEAEIQKQQKGIANGGFMTILAPVLDMLVAEIQKAAQDFFQAEGKEIEKVVLGGGCANLLGLREYVEQSLGKRTVLANPFGHIFYPPILEDTLKTAGPAYAVALGMALRGLE